jgi:exopolysaccharide biosynthesis polyprenyl glycosylphosphotransferase
MVVSYLAADAVRAFALSAIGMSPARFSVDWSIGIFVVVTVAVFYAMGLYEPEAFVSRPLHLWTLLKASLVAFLVSALSIYIIRSTAFDESRVVFLLTFATFVLLACVIRLGILDGFCGAWVRDRRPISLLVGDSDISLALSERLGQLRGFDRVEHVAPNALTGSAGDAMGRALDRYWPVDARVASVFIDATCMAPRDAFKAASAAQALGAEVYVVSALLEALEGNRLLSKLFEAPVVRLRSTLDDAKPYFLKRAFDIVGSAALLLLSAPVMAVCGVMIRATSPGPVFYKQTRVGRDGVPFEFLKLRSMVMNDDACIHSEYVRAFMNGTAEAIATVPGGEAIYKRVDDPRITPVGRFVRKYSLDEIPQFWNVFRGDMSLVGPRPPLPYEVNEYSDWDTLRLSVPAGITGLWQVEGRSRVSFDEMILQDLMYAQSMRLLVDVGLCLRTLPATLLGGGGG